MIQETLRLHPPGPEYVIEPYLQAPFKDQGAWGQSYDNVILVLILCPDLPMFCNVSHEKLGRPGEFYDVMMTYWTRFGPAGCGWLSPPTAHTMLFYTLSSQYKYIQRMAQWQDVLARAFESSELGNKTTAEGA